MQIQDANTKFGINANAAKYKLREFIFKKIINMQSWPDFESCYHLFSLHEPKAAK